MSRTNRLIAAALFAVASLTAACPPPALACGFDPTEEAVLDAVQAYVEHTFLPRERGVVTALDDVAGTASVSIRYEGSRWSFLVRLVRVDGSWQVVDTQSVSPPEA